MPSLTQAVSAVSSFGLVVIVLLVWWWSDLDGKAKQQQDSYLKSSEKVEILQRRAREHKDTIGDLEGEVTELKEAAGTQDAGLKDGDTRVQALAEAISALRNRADMHRQVLTWLSYALVPFDDERDPTHKDALGGDLDVTRVYIAEVTQQQDIVLIEGGALEEEDIDLLVKRLSACGYLASVKNNETTQKTDTKANRSWQQFKLSAELRAPALPDLLGGDDE